jgi:hypothetical protein
MDSDEIYIAHSHTVRLTMPCDDAMPFHVHTSQSVKRAPVSEQPLMYAQYAHFGGSDH